MDTVKLPGSLDFSILIFARLQLSPVRSTLAYVVKRFGRYMYNACVCPAKRILQIIVFIPLAFKTAGFLFELLITRN